MRRHLSVARVDDEPREQLRNEEREKLIGIIAQVRSELAALAE